MAGEHERDDLVAHLLAVLVRDCTPAGDQTFSGRAHTRGINVLLGNLRYE